MSPRRSPRSRAFEVFAEATEPTDAALQRLRRSVLGQVTTPASSRALLRHLEPGTDAALARVRQGVQQRLDQPAGTPFRYKRGLLLAAPLLSAPLLAAALSLLVLGDWSGPDAPVPVRIALESDEAWSERELTPGVLARYQGSGSSYAEEGTTVTWREGTLELTVEPNRGHRVSIRTAEAEVRVVGTMLAVRRDALGTRVEVSHGRVEVSCSGSAGEVLIGGQSTLCLPLTGAGMLGRALALEQQGASSEAVLAAIEAGLALADGPIEGELHAFRIQHLLKVGRDEEALARIEAYLASGTALRRTQMLRAAARLWQARGRCDEALRYLDLVPEAEQKGDGALRARCDRSRR